MYAAWENEQMSMSTRELWVTFHGMVFGGVFLLAYSAGALALWGLTGSSLTVSGLKERLLFLRLCTLGMAALAWLTAISGAFVAYPWYRKIPPAGADLAFYPQALLKANPLLHEWHFFGMEWKEHVAWLAPIAATAVAYAVWKHGSVLAKDDRLRKAVLLMHTAAFAAATVAGGLGALITKAAPIR